LTAMVIFLYGADTYRSRQKLFELKRKFVEQKDQQGLSISSVQADDLSIDKVRRLILTGGLFAEKRMIILEDLLSAERNPQDREKNEIVVREIMSILKKSAEAKTKNGVSKDNIIVFWDNEVRLGELSPSQKKLYQFLKKKKYAEEFKPLNLREVKIWIKKEFEKQGIKIETKTIDLLANIYGNDLWSLKNETNKIVSLQNDSLNVHFEDLKNVIIPKTEQNIWRLIDALGRKNKVLALRLLSDQFENGAKIDYLLSMLTHQYRTIFRTKLCLKNSPVLSSRELAKRLKMHPYVCQKALEQEKNYTLEGLKKIYQQLLEIDLLRKTRPINPSVLLNLLIVKS